MAWIECNWLHGRWGALKAFIPDHIASQYRRFISFCCCLDRMQSCTSSTNLTICPHFWYLLYHWYKCYQPKGGLHGCLGVFTRSLAKRPGIQHDDQATRLKRAVAVVERCMSCLVSRSISNLRVVYALARRQ